MAKCLHLCFVLMLFFFIGIANLQAQKWVADTIVVDFGNEYRNTASFNLFEIIDSRKVDPSFISVYEQKKWLFFPVDQIVKTRLPLTQSLRNYYSNDTVSNMNFAAHLHAFYIRNLSSLTNRQLILYSSIELSKIINADTTFLGTLYYSHSINQKKKTAVVQNYNLLLDEWSSRFTSDVLSVDQYVDQLMLDNFYHFRRGKHAVEKNLYVKTELFGGLSFWGLDAEIWFSEPESKHSFNRGIGIMRYVNQPDFHAIAYGSNVKTWNYRLTKNWLFTNKMGLFIGINNWKDVKTIDHKFEEILFFNCSFTQSINFNTIDQSGFIFGLGVMEYAHYVIYHRPAIKLGLTLNVAYKF